MLIYIILFLLLLFALKCEIFDQDNSYDWGKPQYNDTKSVRLAKIVSLSSYDKKTIKWRRTYMTSALAAFLLYLLVKDTIPSEGELLLTLLVIYSVYSLQWSNYTASASERVSGYVREHCRRLERCWRMGIRELRVNRECEE